MKKLFFFLSILFVLYGVSRPGLMVPYPSSAQRALECPATLHRISEHILQHTGYTLSFNGLTLCPNWVAWELTAEETHGVVPRYKKFMPDPLLPLRLQVTAEEYRNSGYDRGHMCPSADMRWSERAQRECFFMSNICPQDHHLNGGAWNRLEESCRRWAVREGKVYVACGPVFGVKEEPVYIGRLLKIRIPKGFFKVILSTRRGEEKAIGFYYENMSRQQNMEQAARTVDEIEKMMGMDFFPALDDALERRVEAHCDLRAWH